MEMGTIISQMLVLVILMATGYFLGKIKFVDEKGTALISKLVLYIATPANIIVCMLDEDMAVSGQDALIFVAITVGCYALYYLLALIVPKLIKAPLKDEGLYSYMTMFANCGYMGYPVANAIFGPQSALYVSYFVVLYNILAFSLGIKMMSHGKGEFKIKKLLNPVLIASVAAAILMVIGVRLPGFIAGSMESMAQIMTPLAMIVIGSTLATVPLREVFNEWRIVPMTVVKIILTPIIVWAILRCFITDPLMLGVATVISGMPVGSIATMMSIEYGQDAALASKVTFVTTVLTVVTVPLIVYILL